MISYEVRDNAKKKNDDVLFAITRDLNDLCHYGVPGQHPGQHDESRRWQNHAVYARGNPRYKTRWRGKLDDRKFSNMVSGAGETFFRYEKDPAGWDKAADLGIDALKKMGRFSASTFRKPFDASFFNDLSKKEARDWFLYNDQPLGMPQLAYLMSKKGYSADTCKDLIEYGKEKYSKSTDNNDDHWFDDPYVFSMYAYVNEDDILQRFCDNCEQVLKEQGGRK